MQGSFSGVDLDNKLNQFFALAGPSWLLMYIEYQIRFNRITDLCDKRKHVYKHRKMNILTDEYKITCSMNNVRQNKKGLDKQ